MRFQNDDFEEVTSQIAGDVYRCPDQGYGNVNTYTQLGMQTKPQATCTRAGRCCARRRFPLSVHRYGQQSEVGSTRGDKCSRLRKRRKSVYFTGRRAPR